jgi:hypothetical protein
MLVARRWDVRALVVVPELPFPDHGVDSEEYLGFLGCRRILLQLELGHDLELELV